MINFKLIVLIILCSAAYVSAVEKSDVPSSNRQVQQAVLAELNTAEIAVKESNYSNALQHLDYAIKKIKNAQVKELEKFFPNDLEGFHKKSSNAVAADTQLNENSVVLLTKAYSDSDGNTITVYVVASDPIIKDYMAMISSQKVLKRFQNKSIIKVGNYEAIMTGAPGENYVEQNIVVNAELLVNVFYIGKISQETISKFVSKIDLNRLELYLKK